MISKQYIGDGVYADFDGYQIVLTAENGVEVLETIYLDSRTFDSLLEYKISLTSKQIKESLAQSNEKL